jgi:cytochrome c oxidase subunit 4
MSSHDHEHGAVGHIVPIKLLVLTCLVLLFLTGVTVWVAKLDFEALHMSEMNILVAMGVAVVKCILVALIFMHLRWDRSFVGFVFLASILFVGIFIGFALLDTTQYQPSVIPGNSPEIQKQLDTLQADLMTNQAAGDAHAGHGHTETKH